MLNIARHFKNAVQPLVRCALELGPSARGAWLNELRADCPSVARELERLMRPSLEASQTLNAGLSACDVTRDVVPGSLEHLGLRC